MSFLNFIKAKQKLIIIYMTINFFALFVNIFGIYGRFFVDTESQKNVNNFIFSDGYNKDDNSQQHFWPFVDYIEKQRSGVNFLGVFKDFDYSEFIAYSILLFLILYFRWTSKYKK